MAKRREYTAAWLQVEKELGGRFAVHGTAEEQRAAFDALGQAVGTQLPLLNRDIQVTDYEYSGLRLRTYRSTIASEESLPIGIFAHGGGFVCGSIDSEDFLCQALAERVKTVIVSIEYRCAPEHKAPAQLEDMLTGFRWAYNNASIVKGDRGRVYTIGGSAGGTLALAAARKILLGHTPLPKNAIKGVVSFAPLIFHPENVPKEFQSEYTALTQNATDVPLIDAASVKDCIASLGLKQHDQDYLMGNDLESHKLFTSTYVVTCEFDPLRDDGRIMAKSLKDAGVPVRHEHYNGLPHAFWFLPTLPETESFMRDTVAGIEWVISQMRNLPDFDRSDG
ncbi:Alpha/Beta hydrolase protein [Paraphoma chrysanthemicola]|nr:Alpha/Beta hydrolase protein [Paraphoma chrysanthemicola]